VLDGDGEVIYKNSTIIPKFKFSAATPDDVIDLGDEAIKLVASELQDEPMHLDAITTARFLSGEDWV
jgi:hypothetical protein